MNRLAYELYLTQFTRQTYLKLTNTIFQASQPFSARDDLQQPIRSAKYPLKNSSHPQFYATGINKFVYSWQQCIDSNVFLFINGNQLVIKKVFIKFTFSVSYIGKKTLMVTKHEINY